MIKKTINKRLDEILSSYIKGEIEEIDELLRDEANNHPVLFNFLLEQFLKRAFAKGIIINSKYLLKKYLSSKYKEDEGFVFHGDGPDEQKIGRGILLSKGLFLKIISKLNLSKTMNAYINYLLIHDEEIDEKRFLSKEEIERFKDLTNVAVVLYQEWDEKIGDKPRIIKVK